MPHNGKILQKHKFKILRGTDVMHFRKLPLVAPSKGSYRFLYLMNFLPTLIYPVLIKTSNCYDITAVL